ncbi:MAG: FtsX-like permease family protein [Thermoplasmatota archaeon]
MMRKTFIKKGFREIWQHKIQYFFLILILGMGVAAYSSMYTMIDSRWKTFDIIYEESRFMDLRAKFQYGRVEGITEVEGILSDGELMDDVEAVEYRLVFDVFLNITRDGKSKITKGQIIGYKAFDGSGDIRLPEVNRPLFYNDTVRDFSFPDSKQCYLENAYGKANGLDNGDDISVIYGDRSVDIDVLQRVNVPEYFMVYREGSFLPSESTFGVLMVPMDTAREIHRKSDEYFDVVNDVVFRLKDDVDLRTFRRSIKDRFSENGIPVKTISKEENPARQFIKDDMKGDEEILGSFPIIIFVVSGFGLIMALRKMIRNHRPQIGVFKSLGIPNRTTLIYFGMIGGIIGVSSTLLGWVLSMLLNIFFKNIISQFMDFAHTVYEPSVLHYLEAGAISILICLLCTLIPAWWALRIKPIDAIQTREGIKKTKIKVLAGRLVRMRWMPVPLKLTLRNMIRKPTRTMTSILGITLALALFVGYVTMFESAFAIIDGSEVNLWDYEAGLDGFQPQNISAHWTAEHDEIIDVYPGVILPSVVTKDGEKQDAIFYAISDTERVYDMEYGSGGLESGKIVVSHYHVDKLGVGVGDRVEMEIPVANVSGGYNLERVEMEISGVHSNMVGYYAFMDLETFYDISGLHGTANLIYIDLVGDERDRELENDIIRTQGVSSISHRSERENLLEQYLDIFIQVVIIISILSMVLAAAIVYNLFKINAQEKRREYATMKTLGTSTLRIGYLIFLEALFVMVLGIVLGGIGGYSLAFWIFENASQMDIINIQISFSWMGYLGGSLMINVVILFVSLFTIRYINRINIADVIRERAAG